MTKPTLMEHDGVRYLIFRMNGFVYIDELSYEKHEDLCDFIDKQPDNTIYLNITQPWVEGFIMAKNYLIAEFAFGAASIYKGSQYGLIHSKKAEANHLITQLTDKTLERGFA